MHIISRAGSLALFILFYVHSFTLVVHVFAAPVSVTKDFSSDTSLMSYDNDDANSVHLHDHSHSRYQVLPSTRRKIKHHTLTSKDSHRPILLRRKSVGAKIKDAFKKVGNGIKNAAKKVGNGIKNAAKKVGNGIKTAAKKVGNGIKTAAKKVGNGIKTAAKKVGNGVKTAAKKVGNGIKTAAKKVGNGIKTAAKKVGNGIKTAAKKVGNFVKTTGAKVAKFGLKVMSTVSSVASKVAKFIPGIGKPISAALNAKSMLENKASNAIKANLGSKLEKGMKVMDKIRNPVGGAAGAVISNLKRDAKVFQRELF